MGWGQGWKQSVAVAELRGRARKGIDLSSASHRVLTSLKTTKGWCVSAQLEKAKEFGGVGGQLIIFFFPSKLTVSILCFSVDASVVILTMTGWYHSTMLLAQHPLCTIVCASLSPASSSSSSFSSSCLRPFHKLISNNYRHVNAHWDHNNSFRWLPDSDSDSE